MLSADEEAQIRALIHLVTVLVRRISETDEPWCRELLQNVQAERAAAQPAGPILDKAFTHVIAIIERAIEG
jgi:hypothetical protein